MGFAPGDYAEPAAFEPRMQYVRGWPRRQYYIEGGYIRPVLGSEVTWYNPFELGEFNREGAAEPFFIQLANLDVTDVEAIRGFVNQFGLLGLAWWDGSPLSPRTMERRLLRAALEDPRRWEEADQILGRYVPLNPALPADDTTFVDVVGGFRGTDGDPLLDRYAEPLEEFVREVLLYRATLLCNAWLLAASGQFERYADPAYKAMIKRELARVWPNTDREEDAKLTRNLANLLGLALGEVMHNVRQVFRFAPDGRPQPIILEARSLIEAAYVAAVFEAGNLNLVRFCARPTCRRAFYATRADAVYCSNRCAKADWMRRHRQQKEEREGDGQ